MWINKRRWLALLEDVASLRSQVNQTATVQKAMSRQLGLIQNERTAELVALQERVATLTRRLAGLETSDFAKNRDEYLQTLEQLRASNPGIPMFAD